MTNITAKEVDRNPKQHTLGEIPMGTFFVTSQPGHPVFRIYLKSDLGCVVIYDRDQPIAGLNTGTTISSFMDNLKVIPIKNMELNYSF